MTVQTQNQIVAIDPVSERIVQRYELPGSDHPHGFALDEPGRLAFITGAGNATLQVVDLRSMKIIQSLGVGQGPEVLAWDATWRRLYVAAEGGVVSAFWLDGSALRALGEMRAPPSARTVVRVLATADAIVIGVRADYSEGVGIVSYARSRDAVLDNEDHIKIVLDTYRDRRSGYVFAVNANGARYDALIAGQGDAENANWDSIWEAATARTATGWSAEIRIPAKSLLFRPDLTEWGFNIQRRIQRLQETVR